MTDPSPAERVDEVQARRSKRLHREHVSAQGVTHWLVYSSRALRNLESKTGRAVGDLLAEIMSGLDVDEEAWSSDEALEDALAGSQIQAMLGMFSAQRTFDLMEAALEGGRLKGLNPREYRDEDVDAIVDEVGQAEALTRCLMCLMGAISPPDGDPDGGAEGNETPAPGPPTGPSS